MHQNLRVVCALVGANLRPSSVVMVGALDALGHGFCDGADMFII